MFKVEGNSAFASGDFNAAINAFSQAIALSQNGPSLAVLYSNRSAAYASLGKYDAALADSEHAISNNPTWPKAYGRKGAALAGLHRLEEAKTAYEQGLSHDPNNAALLSSLQALSDQTQQTDMSFLQDLFADQNLMSCLKNSPHLLEKLLSDPSFLKNYLAWTKAGAGTLPPASLTSNPLFQELLNSKCSPSPKSAEMQEPSSTAAAESNKTETNLKHEEDPSKAESLKEKELGNVAYKQKSFEQAHIHYQKALSLDPTNVSLLTNEAAVYFEEKKYDECIEVCQKAVEQGRELRADFKIIARAFGRMGSAEAARENWDTAIRYYQSSLAESRNPEILTKLRAAEASKAAALKALAYDPVASESERNLGNELFKAGNFADAIKHYNEAIKRNEKDPKAYANRAACLIKLLAWSDALKDCEKAIELDPSFVKAYIRKASIYAATKDWTRAQEALSAARAADASGVSQAEISSMEYKIASDRAREMANLSPEEIQKKAMADPEIASILSDPAMRGILESMQNDPKAAAEHMKNPKVMDKIKKLVAAGILQVR